MMGSVRIRLLGRFVITILLLGALAPAMSRAAAYLQSDAAALALLCTAVGAPAGGEKGLKMADCPSCLVQAQGMLEPPQADVASQWLLAFGDVRPSVFLKIEVHPEPRCAAQPRAPPQR